MRLCAYHEKDILYSAWMVERPDCRTLVFIISLLLLQLVYSERTFSPHGEERDLLHVSFGIRSSDALCHVAA